ncbi:hypothetical protein, conserved [Trypanosoma brucei gambiense DAL972]|uniref:RING-type domain-containing protein n=2 Tax=Trypanosoma brucei TaxID=5691 RepID=C9ZVQ7_TRYB9|nr:hypothetical protein, conserved [Trypanosoma brucei gambiense DAL972]RHW70926.1 zinc finger protein [Trypanosoma brucei equiperdum]CBH13495.1 hypothetical protein, conserved [Trypanosoma brucei gambiense DAL972]|eukprot:XP_011775772.1 hypothetical protein, conserved [Trypanosoma brucei gambiense DAL972]
MGQKSSTAANEGRPRSYYLVMGGPSIRYIGGPPEAGPLIFDVDIEKPEEEGEIERAEVFNMAVSVLPKEPFRLRHVRSGNNRTDFALSFMVSATNNVVGPGYTLRVFAGVDIEYRENEGIHLKQAEKSQNPFCVHETSTPEEILGEVYIGEGVQLQKVDKAVSITTPEGIKQVTYAPIVIELTYEPPVCGRERRRAPLADDARGTTQRVIQYTFLDIPDNAADLVANAARSGGEGRRPSGEVGAQVKVVRQLLQLGVEVYELDDVFDLGANSDDENAEDDDDKLCVVCLTNERDTMLLPCRHMCLCYECASMLRIQRNNACPICRVPIERLMTA